LTTTAAGASIEIAALWSDEPPAPDALRGLGEGGLIFEVRRADTIPGGLAPYLDDAGQALTPAERDRVHGARAALLFKTETHTPPAARARALVHLVAGLFAKGAVAVVLPAAHRVIGPTALAAGSSAGTPAPGTVLIHRHVVVDSETVWNHTHGMESLGLPDVECRTGIGDAARADQVIASAVRHLIDGGEALHPGDAVEIDNPPFATRLDVVATRTPDHYGAWGALEILFDVAADAWATFMVSAVIDGAFGSFQLLGGDATRVAFLQGSAVSSQAGAALTNILAAEAPLAGMAAADGAWPHRMAAGIDLTLRKMVPPVPGAVPASALFAAVEATRREISVCTAGDIRVHLLQDGTLVQSTRDHVLGVEAPDSGEARRLPPRIAATLPTRWLGGNRGPAPECLRWPAQPPYRLLICSSHYHHRRAASDYIAALGERTLPLPEGGAGLVAWIDVAVR
jgi:hypothetical protein